MIPQRQWRRTLSGEVDEGAEGILLLALRCLHLIIVAHYLTLKLSSYAQGR